MNIDEDNPIVWAIHQEAVLSLTFGVLSAIVAIALLLVIRKTFAQVLRDLASRRRGSSQMRVLRRVGRAALLTGFVFIATVFAGNRLLDSGTWLAALDPNTAWLIETGGVANSN